MTEKQPFSLRGTLARARAFMRTPPFVRLLVCALGTLALAVLFFVAITPRRYVMTIGMVPTNTISANKDVVDELTTEQRRREAAMNVTPSYHYQEGVTESVLAELDAIFAQLRAVRQYGETLPERAGIAKGYTQDELAYARAMLTSVHLYDFQLTTLLNTSAETLDLLYSSLYAATRNTLAGNITQGQENDAIASIMQIIGYRTDTSLLQNVAQPVLRRCVKANMVIDAAATDIARREASDKVEPVVYKQGQNIVVKGEGRVQAYQLAMLRSLGLLSDDKADVTIYLGAGLLVLLVCALMLQLLRRMRCGVVGSRDCLMLLFISLLITLGASVLAGLESIYLAPVLLCAMLVTALINVRAGLIANVAATLLVASLAAGGSDAYTADMLHTLSAGLVSGTVACLILRKNATRLRTLLTGVIAAACNLCVVLAYSLMTKSQWSAVANDGMLCAFGALIASLLCVALQPLLETLFNMPTQPKLMELSNPNQPLLRRLLLEAPGTYYHSIIVANLAEACAEAIGENPLLARVGGYYHDVGKLKRPLYFKENQLGEENAHDHADPQVSAAILTAHTRDGVALAKQYRLPEAVRNIIAEHHGDSPVLYFYHKALQQADGHPVDIENFRYDGHPPRTKIGAIVMLCDTIEAAVRSMQNPTPERIEDFIVKLVRGKLEDGQLADSPLTLRDIDAICGACTTVLVGVFHERIEYPDTSSDMQARQRHLEKNAPAQKPVKAAKLPKPEKHPKRVKAPTVVLPIEQLPEPPHMPLPTLDPDSLLKCDPLPTVEPSQFEDDASIAMRAPQSAPVPVLEPPAAPKPVAIDELFDYQPLPTREDEEKLKAGGQGDAEEGESQDDDIRG